MGDNPNYQGTTHTDDVIEAMQRGVAIETIRELGEWQEQLTVFDITFEGENPTPGEVEIINEIAEGLGLPKIDARPPIPYWIADKLIVQCQNEIHYRLTGHHREDPSDF